MKQLGKEMVGEPGDDFAHYSDWVIFPEEATEDELGRWFDNIYSDWHQDSGDYTSSGLNKAIQELARRGWSFVLTVSESERVGGIADVKRKPFEGSLISWYDLMVQGMGFATRESPCFVSLSLDFLTLSKRYEGLIKAFSPIEIVGLQAKAPVPSQESKN